VKGAVNNDKLTTALMFNGKRTSSNQNKRKVYSLCSVNPKRCVNFAMRLLQVYPGRDLRVYVGLKAKVDSQFCLNMQPLLSVEPLSSTQPVY
jgi:hypothetical protein